MRKFRTHYDNLKIPRDAPIEVIKGAYRTLAAKHHPDKNPGDDNATRIMSIINDSFAVLSDPRRRAEHDRWIDSQKPPEPPLSPEAAAVAASAPFVAPEPPKEEPPPPAPVAPRPPPRRTRVLRAMYAGLGVVLVAGGCWFYSALIRRIEAPVVTTHTVKETAKSHRLVGKIAVKASPLGAEVSVEGWTGPSPALVEELAAGRHRVTVRAEGYDEWVGEVVVAVDQVSEINVDLLKQRAPGSLFVFTYPTSTLVEVDGPTKGSGLSPMQFERLQPGRYQLTFVKDGFVTAKRTVDVREGDRQAFSFSFMPGTVMVTSLPVGADVISGGRVMGKTPLALNNASPGLQRVELRLAGYRSKTLEGELRSGEALALDGRLDPRESPLAGSAWIIPGVELELMPVASGTFSMTEGQTGGAVTLTHDFWLGRREVTQKQWLQVMGRNPSKYRGDDLPVENVSWTDAMEFCRQLTRQEGIAGHLPTGYVYSLPTEAQWEYAAKNGRSTETQGWSEGEAGTHPVGTKAPDRLGLYDMRGNVWEWCLDLKGPYAPGERTDPRGARLGQERVMRGGSWKSPLAETAPGFRQQAPENERRADLGFRVALIPAALTR